MATIIFPFVAVDGNGHVRANARLYFYETGTTTPQATYSDSALSVTNTNPVVADSNGLFTGIYLGDPPDFEAYKAVLKDSSDVTVWTQDPIAGAPIATPISAALLRGYLDGLERTANTTTTLSIGAGVCADDTSTVMMSLAAGSINCATVGADGLDTGSLAVSTSYHVFAISKTDGTAARLASTSVSSPTMPSGYIYKRRISSFRTNSSSQIIDYWQHGDRFAWDVPMFDISASNPGTSAVVRTLTVPSGIVVEAWFSNYETNNSTNRVVLWTSLDQADTAPSNVGAFSLNAGSVGATIAANGEFYVKTDTSGRIRYRSSSSGASDSSQVSTKGWIDRRGKDD